MPEQYYLLDSKMNDCTQIINKDQEDQAVS